MIASEAEGRNKHKEIVIGMKAISIIKYPLIKKVERVKRIDPISNDIKHNLNLKDEVFFRIM